MGRSHPPTTPQPEIPSGGGWRKTVYETIFEADTAAGKWFDILLILSILASVLVVMLDSVREVRAAHGGLLLRIEWLFTVLFTVEYLLRLVSIGSPGRYAKSFFGVVDLLSIAPTYLSLFFPGTRYLIVIRVLRILRVFRILKLVQYLGEAQVLLQALRASRRKITVFLFTVLTLVIIFGSLMYLVEGETNGFTSIPMSVYWAIVTLTTVGYGDLSPQTGIGRIMAAAIMILGYGIIAVPTGIVTVEMTHLMGHKAINQACPRCSAQGHDRDAAFCKHCGAEL